MQLGDIGKIGNNLAKKTHNVGTCGSICLIHSYSYNIYLMSR